MERMDFGEIVTRERMSMNHKIIIEKNIRIAFKESNYLFFLCISTFEAGL